MAGTATTTRRTMLGAGLAGLAGLVAHALGRPGAIRAADGGPILLGAMNSSTNETRLTNDGDGTSVFRALSIEVPGASGSGTGTAIDGHSTLGTGVSGTSGSGRGVTGNSNTSYGVFGHTDALHGRAGVFGQSGDKTSYGVVGLNGGVATMGVLGTETSGVRGQVPNAPGFIAVHAFALEEATALSVEGTARFSRSGKVSLPRGRSSIDILVPGGLSASSLVLAILMLNRAGVYVQSAVPNATTGKVRINLNKIASSSSSTPVAWFVVN